MTANTPEKRETASVRLRHRIKNLCRMGLTSFFSGRKMVYVHKYTYFVVDLSLCKKMSSVKYAFFHEKFAFSDAFSTGTAPESAGRLTGHLRVEKSLSENGISDCFPMTCPTFHSVFHSLWKTFFQRADFLSQACPFFGDKLRHSNAK